MPVPGREERIKIIEKRGSKNNKEAAAAAGVTLVEAGEETEKEDIVQRRSRA